MDLTGITVSMDDFITIATFLISALVTFWGIKKAMSMLQREADEVRQSWRDAGLY